MAVARRASTAVSADHNTSAASFTITPPAALVSGDVVVISAYVNDGATLSATTPSTGWTSFGPVSVASKNEGYVFVRKYAGEASWVITGDVLSYGYAGGGYSGASGTVDANNSASAGAGTSYADAALGAGTAGGMDIFAMTTWMNPTQNVPSAPSGFTVAATNGMTTANDPIALWDRSIGSGGSQAAISGTFSVESGGYTLIRLALAPSAVAVAGYIFPRPPRYMEWED